MRLLLRTPLAISLALALLTFVALLPFCTKAFHIDDPIFLWPARELMSRDGHVFSAPVNWYGTTWTLAETTNHFPLVSALMTPVIWVAGFSEVALHLEFAVFAAIAIAGIFLLARGFVDAPILATLLVLCSPAFFLSATTVMADVPMLALWVWSLVIWRRAEARGGRGLYLAAGLVMALAALAKYPGIQLVPLLAVAGTTWRDLRWQLGALLIPVAALVAAQLLTRSAGGGVVGIAVQYALDRPKWMVLPAEIVNGLSYLGGCFPAIAVVWAMQIPGQTRKRTAIAALCVGGLVLLTLGESIPLSGISAQSVTLVAWHAAVFAALGAAMLWMTGAQLYERRDRTTLLLALWVFGVFIFASVINWTTNARSLLPMAPALAILAVRSFDPVRIGAVRYRVAIALALSAALSLVLAISDERIADASREAAEMIQSRARTFHGTLWFTGHWGFQWYMERDGAVEIDQVHSTLHAGDLFVLPLYNPDVVPMPEVAVSGVDEIDRPAMPLISPINISCGALFYSSAAGPLPWVIAPMEPQRFRVYRVTQNILPPKASQ